MASRRDVRDNHNMPIGYILDDGSNQIRGFHLTKGYVGYYFKSSDITFDKSGRIYSYGNSIESIIREVENNK